MSTLVRLRDSLSNPNKQLKRLLAAMDNRGGVASLLDSAEAARAELITQTGAEDPNCVRLTVKENRKLSLDEVAELVRQYEDGATVQSLGVNFGLHTQTVRAHLRRRGVTLRSMRAFTDDQEVEVIRLYVEEEWTLDELGARFRVDPSSIRRTLVRRGVPRRARARRRRH